MLAVYAFLNGIDSLFSGWLTFPVRIAFYGVFCGVISTGLYVLVSNQKRITELKTRIAEYKKNMRIFDMEHGEYMALARSNLTTSLLLLATTFIPALISTLPVILIIGWLSSYQTFALPPAGSKVAVVMSSDIQSVEISPPELFTKTVEDRMWLVVPEKPRNIQVRANGKEAYEGNPFAPPAGSIQRKAWWHTVFPDPAGYLDPGAPVEAIHFDFPRKILPLGRAAFMTTWEFTFFISLTVAVLGLRRFLKIM